MQNFGEEKYLGKFHSDFQVFGGILSQRVESRTSIKTNFYKKRKKKGEFKEVYEHAWILM